MKFNQKGLEAARRELNSAIDTLQFVGTTERIIRAYLEATPSGQATLEGGDRVERLAQWLHDEVDYPDPDFPNYSWPDHPDDTGQRGDGWLKIVPKDVQEQFRDIARRLACSALLSPPASAEPVAPAWHAIQDAIDAWADQELRDYPESRGCIQSWSDRIAQAVSLASRPASGAVEAGWQPNWNDATDPVVKLFVGYPVEEYLTDYELRGDEGDYTPTDAERALLTDAIYGVIGDLHEKLRKLVPASPREGR